MNNKFYHKKNFFKETFAVFKEVNTGELLFEKWHYESKAGSKYFYTKDGVYRASNHWGRAAKCRWILEINHQEIYISKGKQRTGFAKWEDFYPNHEHDKTYFVKVDFENKTVAYDHKSRDGNSNSVYRTATETRNVIKKVKNILLNDKWVKYANCEPSEIEQKRIAMVHDILQQS